MPEQRKRFSPEFREEAINLSFAVRARPEITFTSNCCVVEWVYVRFGC